MMTSLPLSGDNWHINLTIFRKHVFQKPLLISVSNLVDTLLNVDALNLCSLSRTGLITSAFKVKFI